MFALWYNWVGCRDCGVVRLLKGPDIDWKAASHYKTFFCGEIPKIMSHILRNPTNKNVYRPGKGNSGLTSIYQPTNAHIISHKTILKHFKTKTLRHVSILSYHHQGALFFAKVILQYSQLNSYLQTRCCGSISCCVGMCCGAVG